MKKILFVINNLERGGAERAFVHQINYLYRQGVPVYLACLFVTSASGYLLDLELPPERRYQVSGLRDLNVLIRREQIEVIYATLELPNILARLARFFRPSLRVVIREGSAVTDPKGRSATKIFKFKFSDILLNWLATKIIAVSDEIRHLLASYQPFYAHKMVVMENGVAVVDDLQTVQTRLATQISRSEFRVLAVASMNYYERAFEYLIRAVALLPEGLRQRTNLVFAGDGALRKMYEEEARKLGIESQVIFRGRLETEALRQEYRQASVFVMCSTAEGSPNVILEAMSFALPVISTRVGSAANMVAEGETGFFIPAKDEKAIAEKLEWLAAHPTEREQMGLAGYARVGELYSFEQKMGELGKILGLD